MFLDRIFKFPTSKTKRLCAVVIVLSVVGVVLHNVEIFSTISKVMDESIPLEWYTVNPSVGRPRFFSPQDAFKEVPNLPTAYLDLTFNRTKYRMNQTCALYPDVFKLSFHNLYWQSLRLPSNTWYLFSAYYENRPLSDVRPAVRVFVAINRFNQEKPFCQLWYGRLQQPVLVRVTRSEPVLKNYKNYKRLRKYMDEIERIFMITCPIPATHASLVPDSVSLVEHKCDTARNHLKVIYNKAEKKQGFAVCATPLNFIGVDYSVRFVEWIEMIHLLGADKIFLYYLHHHRNVSKVLKYYEEKGLVQSIHFSLAGGQPNLPLLQNLYLRGGVGEYITTQLLVQQDCLYRNMYNYEYIVVMDIDEIIMPLAARTWKDLLKDVPRYWRKQATSFCALNYWFYDDDMYPSQNYSDVPFYLHMLKHVHRTNTAKIKPMHEKCFHVPGSIKIGGNHGPVSCFGGCKKYWFPLMKVQLQHYCDKQISNRCSKTDNTSVLDTNIWRYKTALIEKVLSTLNKLGFLNL